MEKTATLNLRVDPNDKICAEKVLDALGISMSTAVTMFLKQIVITGGIPFDLKVQPAPQSVNADLMTEEELLAKIMSGINDVNAGKVVPARETLKTFLEEHK